MAQVMGMAIHRKSENSLMGMSIQRKPDDSIMGMGIHRKLADSILGAMCRARVGGFTQASDSATPYEASKRMT